MFVGVFCFVVFGWVLCVCVLVGFFWLFLFLWLLFKSIVEDQRRCL